MLIPIEVQVYHRAMQGVCKLKIVLNSSNPSKRLKKFCRKECAESKRFKYLEVFEEFPQGARVEIFPKRLEDFSIKFRRDRIFDAVEEKLKRASALECHKEAQ